MNTNNQLIKGCQEPAEDYCLVMMPHVDVLQSQPSMGLGLLHAILRQAGMQGRVVYGNLLFLQTCGLKKAHDIVTVGEAMLGDWMFAHRMTEGLDNPVEIEKYIDYLRQTLPVYLLIDTDIIRKNLLECREIAEIFLTTVTEEILKHKPRIVGCSITSTQMVPALALLKTIRERAPEVVTVLGGPNCETIMGHTLHQTFPWVDYVVSGEADDIISPFFRDIVRCGQDIPREQLPAGVFGPCHRETGQYPEPSTWRATKPTLADLPVPDYDDYFQTLDNLPEIKPYLLLSIPFESSRGCWWAQKKPCSFCSVSGMARVFRSKPYEQVLRELDSLQQRYHINRFLATDSILDLNYFSDLLPAIRELGSPYHLFYQTTALLTKDQIRVMSEAGIHGGQFGIESLNTKALKAFNKNVSGWKNVQILKWCHEFGIIPLWLFLHDFPGEEDAWYQETAELVALLTHLPPPKGVIPVLFFRDSVFFDQADHYGLHLQPCSAYQHVLGLPDEILQNLAFRFESVDAKCSTRPLFEAVNKELNRWINVAQKDKPVLNMKVGEDTIQIRDTRPGRVRDEFELTGLAKTIYLYCDSAPLEAELLAFCQKQGASAKAVTAVLDRLRSDKLLVALDGHLVALAVPDQRKPFGSREDNPLGLVNLIEAIVDKRPKERGIGYESQN